MQRGSGAGAGPERGRSKDGRSRSGERSPVYLRQIIISRSFTRRKSSADRPGGAGRPPGRGDSYRIGASRSTATRHPAPHLPYLFFIFDFLYLILHLCSEILFFPLSRSAFLHLTFFDRYFGLRPTHFDIYPLTGWYNGREGVETWLRRNTV